MIKVAQVLLFLLPFHAFFITWIGEPGLVVWKEILLIVILLINVLLASLKRISRSYFNWLTLMVVLYILFTVTSIAWAPDASMTRIIYGLKYDLALFGVLLIGMSFNYIKWKDYEKMLRAAFYGGTAALTLGLGLHLILGPENFTIFNYRNDWSTYIAGEPLAFCQKIENRDLCRFQGTFSGPNQAAFYILMYIPIALYYYKHSFRKLAGLGLLVALIALVLTFSRSAWIGLFLMGLAYLGLMNKGLIRKHLKKLVWISLAALLAFTTIYFAMPDAIVRPESTGEHFSKWIIGFEAFLTSPIYGLGVGTAGPSAVILDPSPLVTESWFLQVAVHGGIIALSLFVSIFAVLMYRLYKLKSEIGMAFLIILISLIPPLQLLHAFEDSSMTYTLFFLIGSYLICKRSKVK